MKVYGYDELGLYTGEIEAQKDQLTRDKGSFIVPANATKVKPPKFDEDVEIPKWDGTSWVLDESPKIKEKKKKDEEKAKEEAEKKIKGEAEKKAKEEAEKNKKEQEQFASEFGAFVKKFRKDLKDAKNLDDLKALVETLFNSVTKASPE